MSSHFAHEMPFGVSLIKGQGAIFRLWAPVRAPVELVLHRQNGKRAAYLLDSPADAEGWREVRVADVMAGQRYQWRVHTPGGPEDGVLVPDPASRSNPTGVHEPSVVVDPLAFEWDEGWQGRPWTEAVSYELHVGTFTPEGTFDAARDKLSQLAELGITCIQLMPLASFSGSFGWGYDGVLPYAPNPAYGSPESLKAFVQAAHRLGLMVMLDVVYNHFGPDGNYISLYAPGFFTGRHHTPWGAAINFDGRHARPVREFFIHNALYWLHEYQFDGLRFDAVHAMIDNSQPDILQELSQRVRADFRKRHVHLVLENDYNDGKRLGTGRTGSMAGRFDAQWSGDFHHTLHVQLTGEREGYYAEYADQPMAMLAHALTHGFAMEGAPHLADKAAQQNHPRRPAQEAVPLVCTLNFLQNHDQIGNRAFGERLTQLLPEAPLRLAVAILLLSPPPPLLFMGEEHGATTPFLYFANWTGDLRRAVSDGRRKEFAHFSAFADPQARDRIPDPCDPDTFARSKLDWAAFDRPTSRRWHDYYRMLLDLRRREIQPMLSALSTGGHMSRWTSDGVLVVRWAFTSPSKPKARPARCLEMCVNLSSSPQAVPELNEEDGTVLFETHTESHQAQPGHLGPWAGHWRWIDGS